MKHNILNGGSRCDLLFQGYETVNRSLIHQTEASQEVRQELFRRFFKLQLDAQTVQVGHLQFFVATGVDSCEWLEVDIDIERHAMKA